MAKIGDYHATNEQVAIVEELKTLHPTFEEYTKKAIRALKASWISFPHTNEDGDQVQHGARNIMRGIATNYYTIAHAMAELFPREDNIGESYLPYMYLRGCMNGYVAEWIEVLVQENGGIPPETWKNSDTSKRKVVD